jgi:YD repeat-containing protein
MSIWMNGHQALAICVLVAIGVPNAGWTQIIPPPPERPQYDENGVDVGSQSLIFSHKGVSIGPSDHHGLSYNLYYSGNGWRSDFDTLLVHTEVLSNNSTDVVSIGNFSETLDAGYGDNGYGSVIDKDSSGFDYLKKDGTYVRFELQVGGGTVGTTTIGQYVAKFLRYPNGVELTYHYKQDTTGGILAARLQSVTVNTGYQFKFTYQTNTVTDAPSRAAWRTVTRVDAINNAVEYCSPSADSCSISSAWRKAQYSWSGYLYATDANNAVTRVSNGLTYFNIKSPDSSSDNRTYTLAYVSSAYGNAYRVSQAVIDGKTTTYGYSYSVSLGTETVTSYGPSSDTRVYVSRGGAPGVTSFTNALGKTTSFQYDSPYSRPWKLTRHETNGTEFQYDNGNTSNPGRGNITRATAIPKTGSGLASLSEEWVFPSCSFSVPTTTCNQPTSYTDPRDATTDYTYHVSGGKLTETGPPDANGIRQMFRYSYDQRYAWIKDSNGDYVAAPTPIYVLTEERTCLTSDTVGTNPSTWECDDGAGDEVVTSYEYGPKYEALSTTGPNNLLLRGKVVTYGSESRRTCYGYDNFGNRISATSPRAGLSSCP